MNKKPIVFVSLVALAVFFLVLSNSVDAATFCEGSALVENLTVGGVVITTSNGGCNIGCIDDSLSNLGNPGCIENDLELALIFIVFAVLGGVAMWLVQR